MAAVNPIMAMAIGIVHMYMYINFGKGVNEASNFTQSPIMTLCTWKVWGHKHCMYKQHIID